MSTAKNGRSGCAIDDIIIGNSRAIREVRGIIKFAAAAKASVLVTGPSGSGKELVAEALHRVSARADSNFIAVNSGAIPRELIESEMFGHEKGSFTGAINRRIGYFEQADKGTLFLDEIGDMPFDMQVRLLRVLEDQKVRRIGSNDDVCVDVRLIAATNQCLETAIAEGRFREDLFYRLAVLPIELPSLAERIDDIPILVQHFLSKGFAMDAPPRFDDDAMGVLMAYDWPGNIRELRNLVERAAVFFPDGDIGTTQIEMLMRPVKSARKKAAMAPALAPTPPVFKGDGPGQDGGMPASHSHISGAHATGSDGRMSIHLREHLQNEEKRVLLEALETSGGVVSTAARMVHLRRTTFVEKMKRYHIDRGMAMSH